MSNQKLWKGWHFVYLLIMSMVIISVIVGIQQGFTLNGFNGEYATIVTIATVIVLFVILVLIFSGMAVDQELREHDVYYKASRKARKAAKKGRHHAGRLFHRHRDEE